MLVYMQPPLLHCSSLYFEVVISNANLTCMHLHGCLSVYTYMWQLDDAPLLQALRSDMAPALADLDAEAGFQGSGSNSGGNGGAGFGPLTAGRLLPLKLLQLLVPALRYSERCGDAEALLKTIAAENKDAAVFCASETAKIEALRQGKDSGDAAFKRGKVGVLDIIFVEFMFVSCFLYLCLLLF